MSDGRRIAAVAGCCVLAALSPFLAGLATAVLGVVLVVCAVVLIAGSNWAAPTRLVASLAAVGGTLALATVFLMLASLFSGD